MVQAKETLTALYLNGNDCSSTYSLVVTEGGLAALDKPAPQKEPLSNKNAGMNGKQVLYSTVRTDERDFSLPCAIRATTYAAARSYEAALLEVLRSGEELLLKAEYGDGSSTTYKVYFDSVSSYTEWNGRWTALSLKFIEPDPTDRE